MNHQAPLFRLLPLLSLMAAALQPAAATDYLYTKAGSPYTIAANVIVGTGDLLTIQPGAELILNTGIGIQINGGKMTAIGTVENPIRIHGVWETSVGGEIVLNSPELCQLEYVHFNYYGGVRVEKTTPYPDHLIQHCVFQWRGVTINNARVRIFHCVFGKELSAGVNWTPSVSIGELCPQIWYCVFGGGGIAVVGSGEIDFEGRDFFRFNRVMSGVGASFHAAEGRFANLQTRNCNLAGCSPSVRYWATGRNYYYLYESWISNILLTDCDISSVEVVLDGTGPANLRDNVSFSNNWWGTTNTVVIADRITLPTTQPKNFSPIKTTSNFRQADVDGSDGGGKTTQADADLIKKYLVGMEALSPEQLTIADVDGSGTVDLRDVVIIESFLNGFLWKLP
ncbi:MAG: dockerin type I repeat-containing protein [Verrucomicrobia bacterium]|nr:dockerin type I repeat-containing protein [Verrucomicrobiota bacterium]